MEKLDYETLAEMLSDAREVIKPGSHWRHYKGGQYIVKDLVVLEVDNRVSVNYVPTICQDVPFSRPLDEWDDEVEWNGEKLTRFTLIPEEFTELSLYS